MRAGGQAAQVGVDHLLVALDAKNSRVTLTLTPWDVSCSIAGSPAKRAWDLDHHVRLVETPPEPLWLGRLWRRCRRRGWRAFEGDEAVAAIAVVVGRAQAVGTHRGRRRGRVKKKSSLWLALLPAAASLWKSVVVEGRGGDRVGEDRRVRRRAGHAVVADQIAELPAAQELTRQACPARSTRPLRGRRRRSGLTAMFAPQSVSRSLLRRLARRVGCPESHEGRRRRPVWRERMSAWTCSLTSHTLTFIPPTTRPSRQPEGDELAALAVAPEDHLVPFGGVAGVLHADVVLIGEEVRDPVVADRRHRASPARRPGPG